MLKTRCSNYWSLQGRRVGQVVIIAGADGNGAGVWRCGLGFWVNALRYGALDLSFQQVMAKSEKTRLELEEQGQR